MEVGDGCIVFHAAGLTRRRKQGGLAKATHTHPGTTRQKYNMSTKHNISNGSNNKNDCNYCGHIFSTKRSEGLSKITSSTYLDGRFNCSKVDGLKDVPV